LFSIIPIIHALREALIPKAAYHNNSHTGPWYKHKRGLFKTY